MKKISIITLTVVFILAMGSIVLANTQGERITNGPPLSLPDGVTSGVDGVMVADFILCPETSQPQILVFYHDTRFCITDDNVPIWLKYQALNHAMNYVGWRDLIPESMLELVAGFSQEDFLASRNNNECHIEAMPVEVNPFLYMSTSELYALPADAWNDVGEGFYIIETKICFKTFVVTTYVIVDGIWHDVYSYELPANIRDSAIAQRTKALYTVVEDGLTDSIDIFTIAPFSLIAALSTTTCPNLHCMPPWAPRYILSSADRVVTTTHCWVETRWYTRFCNRCSATWYRFMRTSNRLHIFDQFVGINVITNRRVYRCSQINPNCNSTREQ